MSTNLDLTSYSSIRQATFVKMVTSIGTILMSSHDATITIDGDIYAPVGSLLNVSSLVNEIKASQSEVSITLSGIGNNYISMVLDTPIKGSTVEIRRAFFDTAGTLLSIAGNPVLEFSGVVNNFTLEEGWTDDTTQTVTSSISMSCSSILSILSKKITGRRTNHADQDYWFTGDLSMDRVSIISDAIFDFGGTAPSSNINAPSGKTMVGTAG